MSLTETVQESSYLAYLEIATNYVAMILGQFYTHSCNLTFITILFQTYPLTLNQSILKLIHFILFFCAQTNKWNKVESA